MKTLAPTLTSRLAPLALAASSLFGGLVGCTEGADATPPQAKSVSDITLTSVEPGMLLPGSEIVLGGASFLPGFAGPSRLVLTGSLDGTRADVTISSTFVDYDRMAANWPGGIGAGLPSDAGTWIGEAHVETDSALDGLTHRSTPLPLTIEVRPELMPSLDSLQNEVLFVNDPIVAHGEGFLLGGEEGHTFAIVEGCFTLEGEADCQPIGREEIRAEPFLPFERNRVVFPFSPYIAGIKPGSFTGAVQLVNRHGPTAGHAEHATETRDTANSIVEPAIFKFNPPKASLGQYVDVVGGGFVGPTNGADPTFALTLIELEGDFTPHGGELKQTNLSLIGEFVAGQLVRYVVNEEDELGQAVDLRKVAGVFNGLARPVVQFGDDVVVGSETLVSLEILPVKQVVWLRFLPQYVESLRHFGLRAVDARVRDRVFEVARRDYLGVNIDFRAEQPTDFALYSVTDISGSDPNGLGLLGYDNTPGKDDGNLRLHDKIGGVNALTQLDGYPGYGGVFVDSLFLFSQHPGALADTAGEGAPLFDQLFDPFRPDLDANPVAVSELDGLITLTSSESCPAGDRNTQIACAVWALGSMVGTTVSHEIAHSLGLADPGGHGFHNNGDWPNALMDAGGARNFAERAEIGDGPGAFCQHNYDYLRVVLPTNVPDPMPSRLDCY